MPEPKKKDSYFEKIEEEVKSNQSTLSLVLGALIVIIVGVLIFNYFNRPKEEVTPSAVTKEEDVSPESLPGKYTIKEGDTLFSIAENYYKDGYKYSRIVEANNLSNANAIEVGQVLEIPKVEAVAGAPEPSEQPSPSPEPLAVGGADTTIWGPRITGDTYTVVKDDWLSKIAGRAYGDIYAYDKIAKANSIANPDLIEIGMVLKIPR